MHYGHTRQRILEFGATFTAHPIAPAVDREYPAQVVVVTAKEEKAATTRFIKCPFHANDCTQLRVFVLEELDRKLQSAHSVPLHAPQILAYQPMIRLDTLFCDVGMALPECGQSD